MWSPNRRSDELLRVEVEVVLAARGGVDRCRAAPASSGKRSSTSITMRPVGHGARRDDRHRALRGPRSGGSSRSPRRAGRSRGSRSTLPAGALLAAASGSRVMRRSEITGPPFCDRPVWSRPRDVQAVEQRRHAEHLVHGHDAGAADAHHPHARSRRRPTSRRGSGSSTSSGAARSCLRLLAGHDRQERGAVALEAGEVLVARGLVDLRLAAELGLDRHAPTGSSTSRRSRRSPRTRAR